MITPVGTLEFNLSPLDVFEKLVDSTHLKYVDYYYESSKVCEKLDEQHYVVHYTYAYVPSSPHLALSSL